MVNEWMRTSSPTRLATEQTVATKALDDPRILAWRLCRLLRLWSSGRPAARAPAQSSVSLGALMTMARIAPTSPSSHRSKSAPAPGLTVGAPCTRSLNCLPLREETGVG